ncbi:MAG: SGNH/GDSL hydrolase family protein [Bdellovibrionota bacterium]
MAAAAFLESSARWLFFSETRIGAKVATFRESYKDASILVLGACPLAYGIEPSRFSKKAYNLAYLDESLFYSEHYLALVLPEAPLIEKVIVELDPALFFADEVFTHGAADELVHQKMFIRDGKRLFGIPFSTNWRFHDEVAVRSSFFLFRELYFKKLFDCVLMGNCERADLAVVAENGHIPMSRSFAVDNRFKTPADDRELRDEIEEFGRTSMSIENGVRNQVHVKNLIEYGRQRGVRLVFVTPPYFSRYGKLFMASLSREMRELYAQTTAMAGSHAGVTYVDAMDIFAERPEERELFFDPIHLNVAGAKAFTEALDEKLKALP